MALTVPTRLADACSGSPERRAWIERLPDAIAELADRWSLSLVAPFDGSEVSCSWVARTVRNDGTRAVLKMGMPHMEGLDEIPGLRFWDGDPTARLLEADEAANAMLLEACEPGTPLRMLPEAEQDEVIAGLLRRLWRTPAPPHPFRPLAEMTEYWARDTKADSGNWPDAGLVAAGLQLFDELPGSAETNVLLATDLHAGNVLRAEREPWLVIDPKPFVGDPPYDATQHLLNCQGRMLSDPLATIQRFADLLEVDADRVRLWMFARYAAEPRDTWDEESLELARSLG